MEIGVEITSQTMKFNMQAAFNYYKCLACLKGWLAGPQEERRFDWAVFMLNEYPKKKDWHRVRFSDEIHFGYRPDGQLRIIRQPGT